MANKRENEWGPVFSEVCRGDYYKLRSLPFVPDLVLDIGANVGAFTTFARHLFPEALIVAVEPHPRTYAILRQCTSHFPGIEYVNKAIGTGGAMLFGVRDLEPPYFGALCSYVTKGQTGFPDSELESPPGLPGRDGLPQYKPCDVLSVRLDELMDEYVSPHDNVLLKMDCEGGENCIFDHEPSMAALRRADCITMELHYYTKGTGTDQEANADVVREALLSLSDTHYCLLDDAHRHFYARRKRYGTI